MNFMEFINDQDRISEKDIQVVKQDNREEQEVVSLLDYLSVPWKRKWSIIIIVVVIIGLAIVHSLRLPNIYQAELLVDVGTFQGKELETFSEIGAIFGSELVLKQLIKELSLPDDTIPKEFASVFNLDSIAKFLKISAKAESPEQAVKIVQTIANTLISRHENIMKEALNSFEKDVEMLGREEKRVADKIIETKQDIIKLEQEIKNYQNEVSKRADVKSEAQGRIAETYIQLLANSRKEKETVQKLIGTLEKQLIDFDQLYQNKKYEMAYGFNLTKVDVPVTLPQKKIGPNRRANVKMAGFVAVFIGLVYAFGVEGLCRYRDKARTVT